MRLLRQGLVAATCSVAPLSIFLSRQREERKIRCDASRKACASHVCSSKMDMLTKSMTAASKERASKQRPSAQENPSSSDEKNNHTAMIIPLAGCPADKDELGRCTWTLLHTLAAYYPDNPSEEEKQSAMSLIMGLSQLYPCSICVDDFKESVKASPPDVSSRKLFSQWVCRLHNEVNEKVGNPTFECDISKLDERWKSGNVACNLK